MLLRPYWDKNAKLVRTHYLMLGMMVIFVFLPETIICGTFLGSKFTLLVKIVKICKNVKFTKFIKPSQKHQIGHTDSLRVIFPLNHTRRNTSCKICHHWIKLWGMRVCFCNPKFHFQSSFCKKWLFFSQNPKIFIWRTGLTIPNYYDSESIYNYLSNGI